ncbi:anti-sigma factor family protein [Limoniibacter endophyticus]|uniref:Anti-sigma factor n=1 Tax=Limoniibacter endophyticus TaxID=1565040 RepID=A0A8J3DLE8_9HYPH|nr:hypothetical protein [Limoniibacter endophyticus]GHC60197.1 hypothetical protein GCM10010136_00070 [Limoniibacter endophyticus]
MASSQITDDMLMAYVEGALAPDIAAQVEEALADDPTLKARARMLRQTRRRVRATMAAAIANAATLENSASDKKGSGKRFRDGGRSADVPPVGETDKIALTRSPIYICIGAFGLLLLAAATGYLSALPERSRLEVPVGALTSAETDRQLSQLPSGQGKTLMDARELGMVASFRDGDGNLCRQYRLVGTDFVTDAVSCLFQDRWSVRLAVSAPIVGTTPIMIPPPSNMATIDAYRAATRASVPLSPDEEQQVLARLKR